MKKFLLNLVLLAMLAVPVRASIYCTFARFNPTYATICYWEMMMDYWDPFDWGDDKDWL